MLLLRAWHAHSLAGQAALMYLLIFVHRCPCKFLHPLHVIFIFLPEDCYVFFKKKEFHARKVSEKVFFCCSCFVNFESINFFDPF
jgi:hypothetical protein